MSSQPTDSAALDPRLQDVLQAWLVACDEGRRPDPRQFIAQYPEWADELREFLADQERIDRFAQSMRRLAQTLPPGGNGGEPRDHSAAAGGGSVPYLGDYELVAEIARGGMGVVYKARQVSVQRLVALKMILGGNLASSAEVQRFRLEAESAANLDHPHIVPIYEVGEHEGRHYFSMKLIEGSSLAARIAEFRPPIVAAEEEHRGLWPRRARPDDSPRRAARLMATLARAVHFAHQRGIVHRDLKPGNILIDADGQPHITDFGLARRLEGDSNLTHSGAIVGTPAYMAPEQAAGRRDACTTAVDIYSLGAILYELLAGRPPFRGETPIDTLRQVVESAPPAPSAVDRRVERDLEAICLKCLEKDPQQRYSSAAALADDLDRWLAGEPLSVRPPNMAQLLWRWLRKNVRAAVWTVIIGVAAGAAWNLMTLHFTWHNTIHAAGLVYDLYFPSLPAPWLASRADLPMWVLVPVTIVCALFLSCGMGLANHFLLKPRGALADLATGLATGLVAGTSMFVLGHGAETVWSNSDLRGRFHADMTTFADAITIGNPITHDAAGNPVPSAAVGATRETLYRRYPDLRTGPYAEFPEIPLRQKIEVDMRVGLVTGIFWGTLFCLGMGVFTCSIQTLAAGFTARRAGNGWAAIVPCAELAIAAQWALLALWGGVPRDDWGSKAALAFVAIGGVLAGVDWRLRFSAYFAILATALIDLTTVFTTSPTQYSPATYAHLAVLVGSYALLLFVFLWIDRRRRKAHYSLSSGD
jgi:serine/threonine protein kinase